MMHRSPWRGALALLACAALATASAQTQVALTKHNLTVSGPGTVKTSAAVGTCVFCHTPHNANPSQGLWNRDLPPSTYTLYTSPTTRATLNQPTGSSRLCLSCHDGILALETLKVPPKGVTLSALGPLTGATLIGTNLSADHPVSFTYDSALAVSRGQLADPATLPQSARLDTSQQMQCTSCHDPHEDRRPNFLRADTAGGAMCTACHQIPGWNGSTHQLSTAQWSGAGSSPWLASAAAASTVSQNACLSCHRPHAAGHGQWLMAQAGESANCTVCHDGTVTLQAPAKDMDLEFLKPSHHPIESNLWTHAPGELPATMPRHVACADCHNAHTANSATAAPPAASGRLKGVASVNIGGSVIPDPAFEYEVCSKCHGLVEPSTAGISRVDTTRNIRLRIDPANPSIHPIAALGKGTTSVGFQAGYTVSSQITCLSCHNNNDVTVAGTAPAGPHGSIYEPILERQYLTGDLTPESAQNYDLCYKCHNESFLVTNQALTFPHNTHVVTDRAPCAACHDPHGSRQNAHLIDFMLKDRTGAAVVTASPTTGLLQYTPGPGAGHGSCSLMCHAVDHTGAPKYAY